jgi:hypothetical protein
MPEDSFDNLFCRFTDDADGAVALGHRRHKSSGLVQCEVRRERRDIGIGLDLKHHGSVTGKGFLPGGGQTIRRADEEFP